MREPGGCRPQDSFVGDVCQGWTAPERKRLSQEHRRVLGPPSLEELGTVRRESLEAMEIERVVIHS